jgi:1-deoxy-D-xylulose-5-phosphate reductoisomerase
MADLKGIAILGATGSIGRQTLEVIRQFPNKFKVVAISGRNREILSQQIEEFQPKLVNWGGSAPSLEDVATHPEADLVVVATSGRAGLLPTLAAINSRKTVALANKEVLVMAGEIIMAEAKEYGVAILPIDSEHSALWQCLQGEDKGKISRIILTASGGPFYDLTTEEMERVNVEQALAHPTWRMGKKVTIDSATLMNKGMEVIEAHFLFDVPFSDIQVVIHPQSIIHSMVEFVDGTVKAQLSFPDMRLPIQYALTYPHRLYSPLPKLNFPQIQNLSFKSPDLGRFPCLRLAIEAGMAGGTYPAALCAADEVAVELFLSRKIGFMDIPKLIEGVLERHHNITHPSLEEILSTDLWAREAIYDLFSCYRAPGNPHLSP